MAAPASRHAFASACAGSALTGSPAGRRSPGRPARTRPCRHGIVVRPVPQSSEGLDPGGSFCGEDSHRAEGNAEPVTEDQQTTGKQPHLPVRAQDRYVSCQILDLRRLHGPAEPSPMPRTQRARHDEIQALAKRFRRAMPEQRLGTRTPPRNVPDGIDDDDGVICHNSHRVPRNNGSRNIRIPAAVGVSPTSVAAARTRRTFSAACARVPAASTS